MNRSSNKVTTPEMFRRTVTIANSASLSDAIDLQTLTDVKGIVVEFPSVWTAANLAFRGCDTPDGTYVPIHDGEGSRVVISGIATGAARAQIAPAEAWFVCAYPYVKLESVDTADGTAENQGAQRTLTIRFLR